MSPPRVFVNRWAKEAAAHTVQRPTCSCVDPRLDDSQRSELGLHLEEQDTGAPGWTRLLDLIEDAAKDRREEFSPVREMSAEHWTQVVTLPPSIARLKSVKHFILYGSSLVRIPPEIGEMTSLEEFSPYTSHRLHWFPYEITRCRNLTRSTVSTRALYGNVKYRPPFPKLPQRYDSYTPHTCSVCNSPFGTSAPLQFWVSLLVASDVLPLLLHACSQACLSSIPTPPERYVQTAHQGGLELNQPDRW
jgi:hypothetical protein